MGGIRGWLEVCVLQLLVQELPKATPYSSGVSSVPEMLSSVSLCR